MRSLYVPVLILLVFSCSSDLEVLSVAREKSVTIYALNGMFETQDAQFIVGSPEWRPNPQGPPDYAFFKRVTFVVSARGGDPVQDIVMSITLSVADENRMSEISFGTTQEDPKPGKSILDGEIVISNGDNSHEYYSINICERRFGGQFSGSNFYIQRQSVSERLLAGNFSLNFCNESRTLNLNGIFKDIPY